MTKETVDYKPLAYMTNGVNLLSSLAQIGGVFAIAIDAHTSVPDGKLGLNGAIGFSLYASGSLVKWMVESVTRNTNAEYHNVLEKKLAEIMAEKEE